MKKNTTLILTFLMLSIFSIAFADPTPEDAPVDFSQKGPPPPPPAPIDDNLTLFFVVSIVIAFVFFCKYINNKDSKSV